MKNLVVAGIICLAAATGIERPAGATSLFGLQLGGKTTTQTQAPVVTVQAGSTEIRVQQMEDQVRQLNGRIEEMSYQLLQMQETIRKAQEDNEFRFQQLEKTGGGGGGAGAGAGATKPMKKSEVQPTSPAAGGDDVARIIDAPTGAETAPSTDVPESPGLGQPPKQLGSIRFDQNGNPLDGSVNPGASVGSGTPPGVDSGRASQTASLGNESDQYKAAYGHVLSGDYATAEQEFTQYIARYPSSARSADANFWLGEALYSQGKYNDAAKTFLNGYQKYGQSEKAPEMLLKLGMSLAALDNTETACATLRKVTQTYPKASRAVINKVAAEQKRLAC